MRSPAIRLVAAITVKEGLRNRAMQGILAIALMLCMVYITIIPMFAQIVEAKSDKIGHGPISAHMESDGQRNAERWWFK